MTAPAPAPYVSDTTFGMELVLDLHGCDPATIRSRDELVRFAHELCHLIGMKPYGPTWAERFGLNADKSAGYSLVQMIETSCITGHFSEEWNAAYLNIFSCKAYDPDLATRFTTDFFGATSVKTNLLTR